MSRALVAVALLCLSLTPAMLSAQDAPRALCFLSEAGAEWEDGPLDHQVTLTVLCAHADRRVVGWEHDATELEFLDGERDLARAGAAWLATFREENPDRMFGTTRALNQVEFEEPGSERYVELTAHSSARPETGAARLVGEIGLVVEADCVGDGATEPVTVTATAAQLRGEEGIPFEEGHGGRITTQQVGSSNQDPMLTLTGGGAYLGLEDPPEGVEERVFFGKKRLVVRGEAADGAEVRLRVCPTEELVVPIDVEVSTR